MRKILNLDLNNFKPNIGTIEKNDAITLQIKMFEEDYANCRFRLLGKKSDNTFVEQIVENVVDHNNNLNIQLKKEFTNCAGLARVELNIIRDIEERTSREFYFNISNTLNKEIINSITSIETLRELESYISYSCQEIEKIKLELENISYDKLVEIKNLLLLENEKADENIITLDTKTDLANEVLRLLEEKINAANTSKANLKTVIDNSSIAKVNLSTVIETSNTSKVDLENVINNSNTAKNELTKVIETSNTSKVNLDSSIQEAATSKVNLDESIENANTSKTQLDTKITVATEKINTLDDKSSIATTKISELETNISAATIKNTELTNTINAAEVSKTALEIAIESGDIETIKVEAKKLTDEVVEARTDFWGKTHNSLKEKEDSEFQQVVVDNTRGMFLEQKGTGSLTVKNTLEGSVRNLKILGNTTGGYNSETSTSFPLASVGQAEGNKISILSTGKNLFDYRLYLDSKIADIGNGVRIDNVWAYEVDNFKNFFKPNTKYSSKALYKEIESSIGATDTSGGKIILKNKKTNTFFTIMGIRGREYSFTTSSDIQEYDSIIFYSSGGGGSYAGVIELTDIIICEYEDSISYEPYKADKKDILLPFEGGIKSVSESVCDIVELNEKVHEICESIVLNGVNEVADVSRWNLASSDRNISRFFLHPYTAKKAGERNLISDKLPFSVNAGDYEEGVSGYLGDGRIYIKLKNSTASTVEELVEYLKINNITVQYEKANPIIHKLEPSKSLSTFKTLTTLNCETTVEADVEGEFPCEIGGVLVDLQTENKNLKSELVEKTKLFNEKMEQVDHIVARLNNAKI